MAALNHTEPLTPGLDRALFLRLAAGEDATGRHIIQHNNNKHVPGIDLTFTAPKWVSTLMVGATEEERQAIQAEWNQHVVECFSRVEARAKTARAPKTKPSQCQRTTRQQGSKTERIPAHLIGYLVHQHTARPTEETERRGAPPDPHLHSHIFIMNMAWIPDAQHHAGGRWRAVDDWGIKNQAEQMLWEHEGDFARRMEDLGYRPRYIEDRGRLHTVMDEIEKAVEFWSSNSRRRDEIIKNFKLAHDRLPTEAELRDRLRWTRLNKNKLSEAVVDWAGLAADAIKAGITKFRVEPQGPLDRPPLQDRLDELRFRLMRPEGLCHKDAVFDRRSLETSVTRCAVGLGLSFSEIDNFIDSLIENLIVIDSSPERTTWTTPVNWDDEWTIHKALKDKIENVYSSPTPETIERAIAELSSEEGIDLDAEQIAMVHAACEGKGVSFHEGYAGTGKTTAAKAIVRALRDKRSTGTAITDQVIVISTAKDTAKRTCTKLKGDQYHSIESFVLAVKEKRIRPTDRTVIVLDEAAMVDNSRMARLLRVAGSARLICIGDDKQLQSIGAGGWYQDAVCWAGKTMLKNVHRQRHAVDKQALEDLRHGKAEAAIASFDSRGRIHTSDTHAERMGQAIKAYCRQHEAGTAIKDLRIVIEGRNTEIDSVNSIIQQHRLDRGEIFGDGLTMHSEGTGRTWEVFAGDEVSFIAGHYQKDQKLNITNGTRATVTGVDIENRTASLWLTEEEIAVTIDVPEVAHKQAFSPCYAVHAMRLQGGEAEYTYVLPGGGTSSLETAYSSNTRHIEELHLFVDHETHGENPTEFLAERWSQSRPKVSARTRATWAGNRSEPKEPERAFRPSQPMPQQQPIHQRPPIRRRIRKRVASMSLGIGL